MQFLSHVPFALGCLLCSQMNFPLGNLIFKLNCWHAHVCEACVANIGRAKGEVTKALELALEVLRGRKGRGMQRYEGARRSAHYSSKNIRIKSHKYR